MFRFENLAAFYWLIVVVGSWLVSVYMNHRATKRLKSQMGEKVYPFLVSSLSLSKIRYRTALFHLGLIFAVIALARPQLGQGRSEVKSEGIEIMFAVDVSESMLAEDVKPSRLEQAKSEMNRLIDLMPGNKMGIIAFAGSASLLSPITTDPTALKMYVDSLSPLAVSNQGTSFQSALVEAESAFERGGVGTNPDVKVTRVVVVLSDGEDHEPGALDFANKLVEKGIRVFTIAYGTEKGGNIPVRDNMGFLRGYKKDRSGELITTQVKGDALRQLSQSGKGSFYFSIFGGDHLAKLKSDLDQLEKTQFETETIDQYSERFQIPLAIGFFLILFSMLIGNRKPDYQLWKGRCEVPVR